MKFIKCYYRHRRLYREAVQHLARKVEELEVSVSNLKGVNTKQTARIARLEQEVMHLMEGHHKPEVKKGKK